MLSRGELPSISADSVHLQQVLLNLIGNALDATEVDINGIKRVEVLSYHAEGHVRVSVRDSGCGIAPEHLESIFAKLGVENRTAAVTLALEKISGDN